MRIPNATVVLVLAACSSDVEVGNASLSGGSGETSGSGGGDASQSSTAPTSASASADGTHDSGALFDVGNGDGSGTDTGLPGSCTVDDDIDGTAPCSGKAPPDSFDPAVQWSWDGDGEYIYSIVMPLVGNLDDDNGDGAIDLCDTPDIVVSVFRQEGCCSPTQAYLYALDGGSGAMKWKSEVDVGPVGMTPALADLEADGAPEILAVRPGGQLVAFDGTGAVKWENGANANDVAAVAVADLDNSGAPEIIVSDRIFAADGSPMAWGQLGGTGSYDASVAVDLDGDMDLEVVTCGGAMHHDGTVMWTVSMGYGYPQVADFDADGAPEILCANSSAIVMLEADGSVVYQVQDGSIWNFPATVHDLDGDGAPEYALGTSDIYSARRADGTPMWSATVDDQSGIAAGTAFDFLGDGTAEAMYADEWTFFVFDGITGDSLLEVDRSSGTLIEYPVVADVDNDASAEAVIVSNYNLVGMMLNKTAPTVQVVRDARDRWVPARRIWNQHTYHVTNVREDGTIPQFETPHWTQLNTFRTQAQIEAGGGVCQPEPEG
ncbi:MAG: hypothetical protein K1X88_04945 [Nannocystaceae bacterium]|nr:hypothetical protein [Nannocystaceae bacterium]